MPRRIFLPMTAGIHLYTKVLFGCACIYLNPYVLKWIGVTVQHMWIEVDTHASEQALNIFDRAPPHCGFVL
jgi:hypothetical protein